MPVQIEKLIKNERSEKITNVFQSIYKKKPDFFVRVPGRVNLIGEHIDYCGYGVCPMALDQDIFLAVGTAGEGKKLRLHNVDRKFEDFECELDDNIEISLENGPPKWYQYFLCGIKGILETLPKDQLQNLPSICVVVSGTVPQSAGLSSSSALVSAAALAAAHSLKLQLPKEELANLCARCERYIGTQGGGMDQAIAFLAKEGCAKYIEFEPLRSTEVILPTGAVFVIAHSLTNLNKAATGDFNCRVVECRLAAQIIAHKNSLDWTKIKRLGDLQKLLGLNLDEMLALTGECLKTTPYTKQDIIQELNTTSSLVDTVSLTPNTRDIEKFKLYQRALHVFNEAKRVKQFYETCKNAAGGEDTLLTLGTLMSQSHESLRDLYECSHPQLDKLVEISKSFTLGTRLTGAGWGGCTVSLVAPENVQKFIDSIKENFFKPLGVTEGFEFIVFTTTPKSGACIYVHNE
ncbi:unnamed protein product [Ceutorhynchus assimilis]|uniref:N-acetylgalactosamine kinase n=1 Tax=Ceutorhynchus assimilis TaxID=467358 RepID=A0A9N9MV11_9CUCU|nr:unnamed protein product [Ceutorhynchus assimilis]